MTVNLSALPAVNAKQRQILQGARATFLEFGYQGASTDEIVRRAGVSKSTVYKYFPTKADLFGAVIRLECEEMARRSSSLVLAGSTVRETLCELALNYVEFLLSPFVQGIYRIVVGESARVPEAAQLFYRLGPELSAQLLGQQLRGMPGLQISDPELAAHQFIELCKARVFMESLFGIKRRVTRTEIRRAANETVEMFLARYSRRKGGYDPGNPS